MEYWVVNMKNCLNKENSIKFLKTLMSCAEKDMSILEFEAI
jgi:hypothetical protein